MIDFNYVGSGGKWYIRDKGDLLRVGNVINSFTSENAILSKDKSTCYFQIDYDSGLNIVKMRKCVRIGKALFGIGKFKKVSLKNGDTFSDKFKLMLNTIIALGKVNAPFVKVAFKVSSNLGDNIDKKSYMTSTWVQSRGGYYVRGKII